MCPERGACRSLASLEANATREPHISKMRFLELLLAFFRRIFHKRVSQRPQAAESLQAAPLSGETALVSLPGVQATPCARFLNSDRKYNKPQNRPTYKAFEPSFDPDENAIVLSMYRLDELATAQIIELGQSVLGPHGGRLHGHAEIKGGEIESLPEKVAPTDKFKARFDRNPERHVTVAPWTADKGTQKLHQMDLAKVARLQLLQESPGGVQQ